MNADNDSELTGDRPFLGIFRFYPDITCSCGAVIALNKALEHKCDPVEEVR
jgi:hypothetical protein